jgi:hypothetical protein
MTIHVLCECGQPNEVAPELAGGIVNCSGCGRAVAVPGLRDPFWRVLQVGAAIGWAAATAWTYAAAGLMWAVVVAVVVAASAWLVSRAL